MFREMYNRMNEKILPDTALKDRVLNETAPKRSAVLRPAAAVAVALAVIVLTVPVMADYAPNAWNWLQNLPPINPDTKNTAEWSCTGVESVANEIRMEVVGITAEDSEARVLLRFEYEDGTPVEGIGMPGQAYFDAYHTWYLTEGGSYHTGTEELMMLKFTSPGGNLKEFYDSQITLIVESLRLTEPEIRAVPLALTDCDTITVSIEDSEPFGMFGVGVTDENQDYRRHEEYTMIAPGEAVCAVTENIGITGMCYIDGWLHIQILQTVPYDVSSFSAWLEDDEGNRLYDQVWHDFGFVEGGRGRECCFDISPEELDHYRLMVEVENGVKGPWRVSFELNE